MFRCAFLRFTVSARLDLPITPCVLASFFASFLNLLLESSGSVYYSIFGFQGSLCLSLLKHLVYFIKALFVCQALFKVFSNHTGKLFSDPHLPDCLPPHSRAVRTFLSGLIYACLSRSSLYILTSCSEIVKHFFFFLSPLSKRPIYNITTHHVCQHFFIFFSSGHALKIT